MTHKRLLMKGKFVITQLVCYSVNEREKERVRERERERERERNNLLHVHVVETIHLIFRRRKLLFHLNSSGKYHTFKEQLKVSM